MLLLTKIMFWRHPIQPPPKPLQTVCVWLLCTKPLIYSFPPSVISLTLPSSRNAEIRNYLKNQLS